MFYICATELQHDKRDGKSEVNAILKVSVADTTDGVIEVYDAAVLANLCKRGIVKVIGFNLIGDSWQVFTFPYTPTVFEFSYWMFLNTNNVDFVTKSDDLKKLASMCDMAKLNMGAYQKGKQSENNL